MTLLFQATKRFKHHELIFHLSFTRMEDVHHAFFIFQMLSAGPLGGRNSLHVCFVGKEGNFWFSAAP